MNSSFCNVALSVPLRTTFTYAVPEELRDTLRAGTRVLVPFRKKSLVGVVVELADAAPKDTKIREITRVLDIVPPLTSKLIGRLRRTTHPAYKRTLLHEALVRHHDAAVEFSQLRPSHLHHFGDR